MREELNLAEGLLTFIHGSPTAFHAVERAKSVLEKHAFCELRVEDDWALEKGGKYYIVKNDSALVAFVVGSGDLEREGLRIIGAHTDSPSFRIKPKAEMIAEEYYIKLNTETYGGPILSTWMDRPLSVAGRVTIKGPELFSPVTRLVDMRKPILVIPNLAIHMNREINSGMELNKQKDMLPLMATINEKLEKGNYLLNTISEDMKIEPSEIMDFDLFLYEAEKGIVMGLNDEFILSPRLDDLAMVYTGITALCNVSASSNTGVFVCFDNEEVGNTTKQGANSQFLSDILERIVLSAGGSRESYFRTIAKSFMISADLAHAAHPNVGEKCDPQNRPLINKGPVIKVSANMKYATDSVSSSVYARICENANVPCQWFVNRSDEKGGSTIGPIVSSRLGVSCVDIGTPILAMHSAMELGGVLDHWYVLKTFEEFYNYE